MTDLERQMRQVAAQYGAECWQLREPAIVLIEGGARQVLPAGCWVVTKDGELIATGYRNTSILN